LDTGIITLSKTQINTILIDTIFITPDKIFISNHYISIYGNNKYEY